MIMGAFSLQGQSGQAQFDLLDFVCRQLQRCFRKARRAQGWPCVVGHRPGLHRQAHKIAVGLAVAVHVVRGRHGIVPRWQAQKLTAQGAGAGWRALRCGLADIQRKTLGQAFSK
jgi:hypothetical protein